MSNALGEGSSSHSVDDHMSVDHDVDMPLSPAADAAYVAQLFSNTSIGFSSSSTTSLATTLSHTPLASLCSAPRSVNSGSADSGKSKHKFLAVMDQDTVSLMSSKKKALKCSTHAAASNVTQAVAYNGFQGSINCLTDIFEKLMTSTLEDSGTSCRDKTLRFLQEVDGGLSSAEKVKLVSIFMDSQAVADTYLSLTDGDIHCGWLHSMINSLLALFFCTFYLVG